MVSMALCSAVASCDVHSRDDWQVCGHTLRLRVDRSRRTVESYGIRRCCRGPTRLVRSFAHLPRSFLKDRRKELTTGDLKWTKLLGMITARSSGFYVCWA
jgi:hypothetical protein